MPPSPLPPRFDSAGLLGVIPVGATGRAAGREITLASVERYADGFVGALAYAEPADRTATASVLAIDARDDRSGHYEGQLLYGYGHSAGSPGGATYHRMLYGFTPALADGVTALTLDGVDAAAITGAAYAGPPGWTAVPRGERWSITLPLREDGRAPDEPDAPRYLDDPGACSLRRVVAAGALQTAGDVTVVVYSLELYRQGFVALAGIECLGQAELVNGPDDWTATDDLGTAYRCVGVAEGPQSLTAGRSGWRLDLTFDPAVPADAQLLRIRLDSVRVHSSGDAPDPRRSGRDDLTESTGAWSFELDIAPGRG